MAAVELSLLFVCVFICVICVGIVERSLFKRLIKNLDGKGLLICFPRTTLKMKFGYIKDWLIDTMEVNQILAFVFVASLCGTDQKTNVLHDCFYYNL